MTGRHGGRAARVAAWALAVIVAITFGAAGSGRADERAVPASGLVALSGDGHWLLAASADARTLVLLDAERQLVKRFDATTLDGKTRSRVAELHDLPRRRSFVVALHDIAELWEISYDPQAAPIHDGLVHDYRMGEAIAKPGTFNIRRTPLDAPLGGLSFDAEQRQVLGVQRATTDGPGRAQIIQLDIRRKIAELPAEAIPPHAAGSRFHWQGGVLRFDPASTPL